MTRKPSNADEPRSVLRSPFDFNRQDNQRMEALYFRSFQHFEPDAQTGIVTHLDSPDFQIRSGNRVIGVEVMQLFKSDGGGKDVESAQDRILEAACAKAEAMGLPPAHVTLFFNLRGPPAARDAIADAVVKVIAANMPADGVRVELEHLKGQPPEVDLITVSRICCEPPGRWQWLATGATQRVSVDLVQAAIAKKAKLLADYRKTCEECWLLLVADSFRASGNISFDQGCEVPVAASPFARTYILDFGRGRLYPPWPPVSVS